MNEIVSRKSRGENEYRIMLLLNESSHTEQLTEIAIGLGHEVVPIKTIRSAMEFLDTKDHVDVVVSETFLKDESVFDFLNALRAKPDHRDVPIMLIAANPSAIGKQLLPSVEFTAKLLGEYKLLVMENFDSQQLMREIDATVPKDKKPKKEENPAGAY